jgi:hypothetical protein
MSGFNYAAFGCPSHELHRLFEVPVFGVRMHEMHWHSLTAGQ